MYSFDILMYSMTEYMFVKTGVKKLFYSENLSAVEEEDDCTPV